MLPRLNKPETPQGHRGTFSASFLLQTSGRVRLIYDIYFMTSDVLLFSFHFMWNWSAKLTTTKLVSWTLLHCIAQSTCQSFISAPSGKSIKKYSHINSLWPGSLQYVERAISKIHHFSISELHLALFMYFNLLMSFCSN